MTITDPIAPNAVARLREYLDEHLKRRAPVFSATTGDATGETFECWDVLASDNHYGDLDNILDMLPEVFAAHAEQAAEVERLRAEVARLTAILSGGFAERWYAYDPECGHETYKTAAEARHSAEASIENLCDGDTGWHENVTDVEWGLLVPFQETVLMARRPMTPEERERWSETNGEWHEYGLRDTSVPRATPTPEPT